MNYKNWLNKIKTHEQGENLNIAHSEIQYFTEKGHTGIVLKHEADGRHIRRSSDKEPKPVMNNRAKTPARDSNRLLNKMSLFYLSIEQKKRQAELKAYKIA